MSEQLDISFDIETLEETKGGANKFKTERPKEGVSYYRILPPYGTKHNKSLSHKYMVHWGFIGANGNERSYACSYLTEGYCPICQKVYESQKEKERADQAGDEARSKELDEFLQKFRARKFFIYNAVTLGGAIIKLELPSTAHEALGKKLKELAYPTAAGAKAFDPADIDTGVWVEIKREGKGLMTRYTADVKRIWVDVEGEQLSKLDRTPLPVPADVIQQLKTQILAAKTGELVNGPLGDIHTLHEPMSSMDLRNLMNGVLPAPTKTVSAPVASTPTAAAAPVTATVTTALPSRGMTADEARVEMERLQKLQAMTAKA